LSNFAKQLVEKELREKTGILDLGNCGLEDLEQVPELYECTHLKRLNLGSKYFDLGLNWKLSVNKGGVNAIRTLPSSLDRLIKLDYFCAFDNQLEDINAISDLTQLKYLILSHNNIKNLQAIDKFQRLEIAFLNNNNISDIIELGDKTNLCFLGLSQNEISDIRPLSQLTGLLWLYLDENKIRDLSPLEGLTKLIQLDLGENDFEEIGSLKHLENLKLLGLSGTHVTNLSPLSTLKKLEVLELLQADVDNLSPIGDLKNLALLKVGKAKETNDEKVDWLSLYEAPRRSTWDPLRNLQKLEELVLYCSPDDDLSPLRALHRLNALFLSGGLRARTFFEGSLNFILQLKNLESVFFLGVNLRDFSFLRNAQRLKRLVIQGNEEVDSLKWFRPISGLKGLHIYSGKIESLEGIEDLAELEFLSIDNNDLVDIESIGSLSKLKQLSLSGNQIVDLTPLVYLNKLEKLDVSKNQLEALSSLAGLPNLRILDISKNRIKNLKPVLSIIEKTRFFETRNSFDEIPWDDFDMDMSNFKGVFLGCNPFRHPPLEIVAEGRQSVLDYFAELEKGSSAFYESKLILVGNGRVGKTSLVRRLLDDTFDEKEPSTHAIQLRKIGWEDLFEAPFGKPLNIHIWDFGGQDIYHATHRVFMKTKALFLVLWEPEGDRTSPNPKEEETEETYPGSYWLSHVHWQGDGSPAMLIQTKRDLKEEQPPPDEEMLRNHFSGILKGRAAISSKTGRGIADLREKLEDLIREQLNTHRQELPVSWLQLRRSLDHYRDEGRTDISWKEYEDSCDRAGMDMDRLLTPLKYLHNSGFLFYQKGLFQDRVILDQKWAIQNVYSLFDRSGNFYRLFQRDGFFKGAHLLEVWPDKTVEECELLASFMASCSVCTEWHSPNSKPPFPEREFLAPQLLPDGELPNQDDIFYGGNSFYLKQRYDFLHPGVIQRLIIQLAPMAIRENVRKSRILVKQKDGLALVEAFPERREIVTRIRVYSKPDFLKRVLEVIKKVNEIEKSWEHWLSKDGENFVRVKELESPNSTILSDKETWIEKKHFEPVSALLKEVFELQWQPESDSFAKNVAAIEKLIRKDRLEEGVEDAKSLCRFPGLEGYNYELTSLQSRIEKLQKEERMRTKDDYSLDVDRNRIRKGLLDLLEKIKRDGKG